MAKQGDMLVRFARFFLIFAVVYFGVQMVTPIIFPEGKKDENENGWTLKPMDRTVKGGHHPILLLDNGGETNVTLLDTCPMPPMQVFRKDEAGEFVEITTGETALPCEPFETIPAGKQAKIDLAPWKYSLFDKYGDYEIRLTLAREDDPEEPDILITHFSIHEPGAITKLFRVFITKPFLNFLILIASFLPDHNLGIAIIVLTLVVKLALFFPTQHAMEGQKKLQKLQPKLDEMRKKYKDNPEQLNKEIMKLWKEHDVNPLQSCLPMLLQFPILIGVFFVIRDGSILEISRHLIYPLYQDLSWGFGSNFFGLDLTKPSIFLMPPLLFILQFAQMKLSFAIAKKKKEDKEAKEGKKDKESKEETKGIFSGDQQQMQQTMMTYGLPILIAVFAFQFPAAVSLYWAVSTVFGIGQQMVVNRRTE